MTSQSICLSDATRAQLSRLPSDARIHYTLHYDDIIVGVFTTESPPVQIVLPGGINCKPCNNITAGELAKLPQAEKEMGPFVTLRMQTCFQLHRLLEKSRADQAANFIDTASLITVNDKAMTKSSVLSDIIPKPQHNTSTGASYAYEVGLYTQAEHHDVLHQLPNGPTISHIYKSEVEKWDIDVIAHLKLSATLDDICFTLKHAVGRYMCAAADVVQRTSSQPSVDYTSVQGHHFDVLGGHLGLTYVTPATNKETDELSITSRRSLHEALALPTNQPMLRKASCAFEIRNTRSDSDSVDENSVFTYDGGCKGRLSDVHLGLKPPHGILSTTNPDEVSVHMVNGHYLYCHYMQDKIDDSGWGCAYRSLMTLLSWCVFQRYTSFPPANDLPKHADIQRALVAVGDKPSGFVDKHEWIGANEVCYALDELTGVQSKILHVASGADVSAERGREFAAHFDQQGTPIMIGGGVLAWTMLGIARNKLTGQCVYLILDPHYKGRDDLQTIQSKGWVAWKSEDIFDSSAFYNFCLPQRPDTV